jgi:hypothetical protein
MFGSRQISGDASILASDSSAHGLPTVGKKYNTQGRTTWAWSSQNFGSQPCGSRWTRAFQFFWLGLHWLKTKHTISLGLACLASCVALGWVHVWRFRALAF